MNQYIDKINAEIVKYNQGYDKLSVRYDGNFAILYLDGKCILTGYNVDIYHRIRLLAEPIDERLELAKMRGRYDETGDC